MDKLLIEDMKRSCDMAYRSTTDQFLIVQAVHAYAALCQAEAMERMADAMQPQVITVSTGIAGVDADGMRDDANNRGDQSIADAISEQVTDPPDEPWPTERIRAQWSCLVTRHKHPSRQEAQACVDGVL